MSSSNWKKKYEFLKYLISIMPGNIYWKDRDGIYLGCNNNLSEIHGFKNTEEIVGTDDYDMLETKDADVISQIDNSVMMSGKEKSLEEKGFSINGDAAIYLTHKIPIRDKHNIITGMAGISLDITDRKKAEEELKKAKELAELANKVKTEFLDNMRHDLRTSLSGIQGFSELLRREIHNELGDTKINEYANNLVASCQALTNIHNQILHAIRVFSCDVPAYRSKFNLEDKLKQIVNLHLAKANEKGLQLRLKYDKKIPKYLAGDCKRLTAIALELVSNALKYTDKGKVTINAKLEKKEGHRNIINFSVQDTGIGIAEDKKEEIFTRFGRLTPSYEGKYIGLGLGLSVVKQFIDDLDGEIYVKSKPQEGTTFTCYLPFTKALSDNRENVDDGLSLPLPDMAIGGVDIRPIIKKASKEKNQSETSTMPTTTSILQVEDEPICAMITKATLGKFGVQIDLATTGKEALQKSKDKNYDLILMDVGLPDINGMEVTRKIRIEEKVTNKHIPIVALTAHIDSESKQKCVEAGMDAVLSKPIAGDKFIEILNAFIPSRMEKTEQKVQKAKQRIKPNKKDEKLLHIKGNVIDFAYMQENFKYGEKEVKKLLGKAVLPSLTQDTQLFENSYKKKDWETVQKVVHKIAGTCSYGGMLRLRDACRGLEAYLRNKKTKLIKEWCQLVMKEYKAVQDTIKKF